MFSLRRPSRDRVDRLLGEASAHSLSYPSVGLARTGCAGFDADYEETVIGHGAADFARAKQALREWRQFDFGWVEIFPARPALVAGTNIAVLIRHLGFYSLNGGRIVYATDQPNEFAYAYGTLSTHAECGEEIFSVRIEPASGDVIYSIRAVSRPRSPLARLGYPIARVLQARFRRDSARAMRDFVQLRPRPDEEGIAGNRR